MEKINRIAPINRTDLTLFLYTEKLPSVDEVLYKDTGYQRTFPLRRPPLLRQFHVSMDNNLQYLRDIQRTKIADILFGRPFYIDLLFLSFTLSHISLSLSLPRPDISLQWGLLSEFLNCTRPPSSPVTSSLKLSLPPWRSYLCGTFHP